MFRNALLWISFCLLFVCASSKWIDYRFNSYVGSKFGTQEYKDEMTVIKQGIEDRKILLDKQSAHPPKDLLCVSFPSSNSTLSVLPANINRMGRLCDWALIFYDSDAAAIEATCKKYPLQSQLVMCRMFPMKKRYNATTSTVQIHLLDPKKLPHEHMLHGEPLSIAKSVLITEILPLLPRYKRVFMMDEDISLAQFSYRNFSRVWDCAFAYPPLAVQPLIAESSQDFSFFHTHIWNNGTNKQFLASGTGFIEQQVPLFDAMFFEWYLKHVIKRVYQLVLKLGTDWGFDKTLCAAAKMYSTEVLRRPQTASACAVLPAGSVVNHLNGRTMSAKKTNWTVFRFRAEHTSQHYIKHFPTWVLLNYTLSNPLDPRNKGMYEYCTALNKTCLATIKNNK